MNQKNKSIFAAFIATMIAGCAVAERPDTDGAKVGVWTQDYDAAIELAKTKNLPVMLNFTGSDWCGWCKLMDKSVFATDTWKKWAVENVVLAFIDFPQKKSLVPEKFVSRNQDLATKYGIRGYPTYIVINAADGAVIGQLGASRDATPEKFIADLEGIIQQNAGDLSKYLSPEDAKKLERLKAERDKAKAAAVAFGKNAQKELTTLNETVKAAKDNNAKKAAKSAFEAKIKALDSEFQKLLANVDDKESKISAILKKAIEAKKAAANNKAK